MTICGKPGSGKTTLLKFVLRSDKFFFKQFDYVYVVSPSYKEYEMLFLPEENFCKSLDWNWIKNVITKHKNTDYYTNILFIFDDIISDLYLNRFSKEIMDFVFNRRHLLNNGMISIILTSQKYTRIPTEIRSCSNIIIFFKLNNICLKKIYEDLIFEEKDNYDLILDEIFNENEQNFLIYRLCNNTFYKNFDKIIINK
jgi:Cdc6-like AAA superfamily ATPase